MRESSVKVTDSSFMGSIEEIAVAFAAMKDRACDRAESSRLSRQLRDPPRRPRKPVWRDAADDDDDDDHDDHDDLAHEDD